MNKVLSSEEDEQPIHADVNKNPQLELMFKESEKQYRTGLGMTTSYLLKSLKDKDIK